MFYGLKKTFKGLNVISEEHDVAVVDLVINAREALLRGKAQYL